MSARIEELVLPGPELVVAPLDAQCPVVLRITRVSPHGTAFRYDLEYSGLDPGEYDLRHFLRRKDGTAADQADSNVPAIPVAIRSVLAPERIKPNAPAEGAIPSFGGYRTLLVVGAVAWTIGLLALLFARRQRRRAFEIANAKPRTLAERLRPLVESARAGTLSRADRAALELGLFAYWSRKLGLDGKRPAEALATMREHADAGPLFLSLEDWLHRPDPRAGVDVAALLAPYSNLPADEFETKGR
jgi:hypothetical protein